MFHFDLLPIPKTAQSFLCDSRDPTLVMLCSNTTHVVMKVDRTRGPFQRTKSYLLGVLQGAWLLSDEWLEACNQEGAWVDEKPFLLQVPVGV